MRRGLVALATLLACVWAVPALSAGFTVPPTPSHFVTDSGGALSQDAKTALESELAAYQKATGHQIIVWIGDTTGNVPLETWTGDSAHQWKIGRHGHDDGAVLFLFMKDHRVRIEVGYGLESSLTDADASRIIQDDITPRMRSGNVDEAVSSGVAAMLTTITPSYKERHAPAGSGEHRKHARRTRGRPLRALWAIDAHRHLHHRDACDRRSPLRLSRLA